MFIKITQIHETQKLNDTFLLVNSWKGRIKWKNFHVCCLCLKQSFFVKNNAPDWNKFTKNNRSKAIFFCNSGVCLSCSRRLFNPLTRKSRFCVIFAVFFQCRFMSETQVLMKVSDLFLVFSRNHFLEGGSIFQWEGRGKVMGGVLHEGHWLWLKWFSVSPHRLLWETLVNHKIQFWDGGETIK